MSQQQQHQQQQPNNFLENMKKATSKIGSTLVDAGAKTMLKTDMVFLERDIKSKKQELGLQIYDILTSSTAIEAAPQIQKAFDETHAEVQKLQQKWNGKMEEMRAIDRHAAAGGGVGGSNNAGRGSMNGSVVPGENVEVTIDAAAMEYGDSSP
mmetsp:Transcript_15370/g.32351  ORF Transcript_15370/g.32351 Transcript_15370/m.32351 type:complete len:153 (-) Transcript_15370:158-616(-)|eukprot:CAMPEP_0171336092 /NCGR_PEP_ID=MMETSP0878-20121228/5776_1 /TAXON_ID=67004 /ORGANISM="Thalassiosira weissflogii, Strain CCMP1336" /LENGTH=152 /DNA_ID=CAMNT_0011837473 /DNA_START=370 /DNA_END=828 /DNA_ORIENTATION=+